MAHFENKYQADSMDCGPACQPRADRRQTARPEREILSLGRSAGQGTKEPRGLYAPLNDHRRTLYWNPNVTTDAEGKAHIEFAGNQTMRRMYISAEGITKDGKAVVNLNR